MPEQTISTTRTYEAPVKTYEGPPKSTHSLSLTLAWLVIIVILLLLIALYVIYFVYSGVSTTYGDPWKNVKVEETTDSISPLGQHIYFVNGGSITRGTNPDYLYVSTPKNTPYLNRTFVIFNTSSSTQLELRPSSSVITMFNENSIGSLFIQPLSSTMFYWYNSSSIIPLITGGNPMQNV